jgi:hypothetical protein
MFVPLFIPAVSFRHSVEYSNTAPANLSAALHYRESLHWLQWDAQHLLSRSWIGAGGAFQRIPIPFLASLIKYGVGDSWCRYRGSPIAG